MSISEGFASAGIIKPPGVIQKGLFLKINMDEKKELTTLDGQQVKSLIEAATLWLKTNVQLVNSLNVFPIPDGDTGSNMMMTLQAGWNEIAVSSEDHVGTVFSAVAKGALMGARGNSGVILSQFWRGIARATENQKVLTKEIFAKALNEARSTAYKGVVRPVEGTILTVLKDTAAEVEAGIEDCRTFEEVFALTVEAADRSVNRTPELLPVLKQAGVVDSGGKGLFFIFEGFLRYLRNESLVDNPNQIEIRPLTDMVEEESFEPGQDYEVVVDFIPNEELILEVFYRRLEDIGVSIQVGEGDGMYRMHIHVPTENLYAPINYIMSIGTVTNVAIENLMIQVGENGRAATASVACEPVVPGQIGVVAVAPGDGIARVLASLGSSYIIRGGQTMNPSTEEILNAINSLDTDKVIILPNNKNIILAANNAITHCDKQVAVIRSKNIPQGISALLQLDPEGDFDEVVEAMNASLTDVQSGEITNSVRSVDLNGVQVEEGQVIVMHNGDLVLARDSVSDALKAFCERIGLQDYANMSLFYGQMVSDSEANADIAELTALYPNVEIEVHPGGQPHYQYIISVE